LSGHKIIKYPISIRILDGASYVNTKIKTENELVEIIYTEATLESNSKKKLYEICQEFDFHDTLSFIDRRTERIIKLFNFYENNPSSAFSVPYCIWVDCYNILKETKEAFRPRLM